MFCLKCGAQLPDNSAFCFQCGEKLPVGMTTVVEHQELEPVQTENTAAVTEYLKHAKMLEVNRYTLNTTINRLQDKINNLGIPSQIYPPRAPEGAFRTPFRIAFLSGILFSLPTAIVYSQMEGYSNIGHAFIMLPAFVLIALVLSLIIATVIATVKRNRRKKNYHAQLEMDAFRVEQEKQQILQLKEQQNQLATEVAHTHDLLNQLYATDVIYPKYRELVPIVTIWEYFDSGRCTELTGTHGAYNLYESESRQDIIISSLNDVLCMLAQIRDNQYALYQAIQESNAIAERICYQNEQLLSVNQSIASNSEVAAYNAKLAAENTSISAFIDYCTL